MSGFSDMRKLLPGTFQDFNFDILKSEHVSFFEKCRNVGPGAQLSSGAQGFWPRSSAQDFAALPSAVPGVVFWHVTTMRWWPAGVARPSQQLILFELLRFDVDDKPFNAETSNAKLNRADTNAKSMNAQTMNDNAKPFNAKSMNDKSTNDKSLNSERTNDQPTNAKFTNAKPTNAKSTNNKSLNAAPTTDKPKNAGNGYVKDMVNDNGYVKDKVNDQGYVMNKVNDDGYVKDKVDDEGYVMDKVGDNSYVKNKVNDEGYVMDKVREYMNDKPLDAKSASDINMPRAEDVIIFTKDMTLRQARQSTKFRSAGPPPPTRLPRLRHDDKLNLMFRGPQAALSSSSPVAAASQHAL